MVECCICFGTGKDKDAGNTDKCFNCDGEGKIFDFEEKKMSNSQKLNKIRLAVVDHMFAGTPREYRAFEFLIAEIDRQHDEFYNEVRITLQDKEMSSYRHAQYAGELREEIISIKKTADVIDAKNQELFNQIAEKDKKITELEEEISHLQGLVYESNFEPGDL